VVAPLVALEAVGKSFGPTRALDAVSLELYPGEVHVLAGENGAGKSTLIRILSGAITDYEGMLRVGGRPARFSGPEAARTAGVATIHQELSLIGPMSVADNLLLAEPGGFWVPRSRREQARRRLAGLGLQIDLDARVESLPISVQQQLEIARALMRDASALVMDEPTSALSDADAERLFERIEELRRQGRGILYISHRMEEIFRLADRISVLRDGRRVLTAAARQLDQGRLVSAMVGRSLEPPAPRSGPKRGEILLSARSLARRGPVTLEEISFDLRSGEILGLAGIAGSGASTLLHALFGSLGPLDAGSVRLAGEPLSPRSPAASIRRGVVLLGSDRALSLIAELPITHNATLSSLRRFSRAGFVERGAERAAASAILGRLRLSTAELGAPVRQLSGGNQQKVALARCLLAEPRLLLLDEPTRGIDVGAKAEVHALIRELAAAGIGVLLVASEMEELLALSDRILVLYRGRIADRLERQEFSRERVLASAMGAAA
jgi:ABC-type sugar transport system ATPase subunit